MRATYFIILGMETVYLDRLFFINLIIDYLLLLISARVCGGRLRRGRFALAAAFGALYAVLSLLPALGFLRLGLMKLCAGLILCLIAFSREEKFFRSALVFFGVSALFGGAVWVLGGSADSPQLLPISLPVLALSFALTYALVSLVFQRSVKNAERRISEVHISHRGRELSLRALIDSGNGLYDPISCSSVLVCGEKRLAVLFPEETGLLCLSASELVEKGGETRFRLIPYSAVGTDSGLLAAFKPEALRLDGKVRDDIIIAVSPTDCGGDGFDCIL